MSLSDFLNEHKLFSFEGESGVKKLEVVLNEIGYKESGFAYGSAVENFLQDNPGAIQAILDFIEEHYEDDFERYTDEEENYELVDGWMDGLSEDVKKAYDQAAKESNYTVIKFIEDAHMSGLKVWYYRGRNFYYGPAVTLDSLHNIPFSFATRYDNLGMNYVVYPVQGLRTDISEYKE